MIRQMAVNQSLEDLVPTSNQTKSISRQKSLFQNFVFGNENFIF